MRKIAYKFIISIMALAVVFVAIRLLNTPKKTDETGIIGLVIENETGDLIYEGELSFTPNDTLFSVLSLEFTLVCANRFYQEDSTCSHIFNVMGVKNRVLLGIKGQDFTLMTDWNTMFIRIDILQEGNYVPATQGVDQIALSPGMQIRLKAIKAWS